ncbi:tRNA wybutosine-synthesizing protein [Myxozyma melibiosi]|uniref:tRNA wybutosine-synthesizing protein 2 n=1 Tax=Myxozyma melibiosi TaxID=54550 RepID=A0ABR1FFI3_9ASCO
MLQVALQTSDSGRVKTCKTALERAGLFDKARGIERTGDGFLIFTSNTVENDDGDHEAGLADLLSNLDFSVEVVTTESTKQSKDLTTDSSLKTAVRKVLLDLQKTEPQLTAEIVDGAPNRYYIYGQLLLISSGDFESIPAWQSLAAADASFPETFYSKLCANLKISHIALNAPISGDTENVMRKPTSLVCLHGEFGDEISDATISSPQPTHFASEFWATTRQNGITQIWAPRYTMFSRGNIKEKARVLKFADVSGKTIVDLYAGIGYFTFSYVHAGARRVLCWEINPWSVEGLLRGARANKWSVQLVRHDEEWVIDPSSTSRIVVFLESNEYAATRLETAAARYGYSHELTHVNMGLLPSSEQSWRTAVTLGVASTSPSTVLHVHANVADEQIPTWQEQTRKALEGLVLEKLSVESEEVARIKSFAPGVMHVCGDFRIRK